MSTLAIEKATSEMAIMLLRGDDPRDIERYAKEAFDKLSPMEQRILAVDGLVARIEEAQAEKGEAA